MSTPAYTIIQAELAKGERTQARLIAKLAEAGVSERGAKIALTRGFNSGLFKCAEQANGTFVYSA